MTARMRLLWMLALLLATPTTLLAQNSQDGTCMPLTLDMLSQGLVTMAITGANDANIFATSFDVLCEGAVRGCVGPALLLAVEYQCVGGEGLCEEVGMAGGRREVGLFEACCNSPPLYTLTTNSSDVLQDMDGQCLSKEDTSSSGAVTGLAVGLTLLSVLTLLLGAGLGAASHYFYHTHHRQAHFSPDEDYEPMKSADSAYQPQPEEIIYDLPELNPGEISGRGPSTANPTPSISVTPSKENRIVGEKADENSDASNEETEALLYTNVRPSTSPMPAESEDEATPPHRPHKRIAQAASCDMLNLYDDTISVSLRLACSLDQGLDIIGLEEGEGLEEVGVGGGKKGEGLEGVGIGGGSKKGEGLKTTSDAIKEGVPGTDGQGYVGVVPPKGVVLPSTLPLPPQETVGGATDMDDRLYEDVSQINLSTSLKEQTLPQKYDYISIPEARISLTRPEPRKGATTPTKATPPKASTLPAHTKPKLPEKPNLLQKKRRGRNSLPDATPIIPKEAGPAKKKGLALKPKIKSHGDIESKRGAKVTTTPSSPLTSGIAEEPADEYIESDVVRAHVQSHASHMIKEDEERKKNQSPPLYEEVNTAKS